MSLAVQVLMPSAAEILLGLSRIATEAVIVSIGWHVVVLIALAAWFSGFRPRRRLAAWALSAPLASVAALAFAFGNPFNGAVFSLLAGALAALALRTPRGEVTLRADWSGVLGSVLMAFGTAYPHFLEGASWLEYLYSAPLGTIPCPTLSFVIGAALVTGGLGLGTWRLTLAAAGCFYAAFGVLHLGVVIDAILAVGAMGLAIQCIGDWSQPKGHDARPSRSLTARARAAGPQ